MIQEIPDKVCKKCGGTRWRYYKTNYKTECKSTGEKFICISCAKATRKLRNKTEAQKILTRTKVKAGPCKVCGSSDTKVIERKKLRLDGTPKLINKCRACTKNYNKKYRTLYPERYLGYRNNPDVRKKWLENLTPEKREKRQCQAKIHARAQRAACTLPYIKSLISVSIGIPPNSIELTEENYQQYKQSLLIHRKFSTLNNKNHD